MVLYTIVAITQSMGIISHDHNFVLKVEIPKHELEHNEAATEEDHTQFEVDMVMFNFLMVPWLYCLKPRSFYIHVRLPMTIKY